MTPTMRDVAKLAGVSQRTVSNVINEYPHVTPQTRARVKQAIEALRYRPNVSAQKLRRGRTGVVALAVPEIAAPYFAELADHVQRQAAERGITLLIDQTGAIREREILVLEGYRTNLIDGLIFSPESIIPAELTGRDLSFPTVWLGESIDHAGVPHISIDNVAAAQQATTHLLQSGRRRVAAVGDMPDHHVPGPAQRRLRGYNAALLEADFVPDPRLVLPAHPWHMSIGEQSAQRLLQMQPSIDAVFCFNDSLAVGVIRGLKRRGARVPDDIAVVGWDDIEAAAHTTPSLTTISPDKSQIARLAVDHLLHQLNGNPAEDTEITAAYELVVRESSGGSHA